MHRRTSLLWLFLIFCFICVLLFCVLAVWDWVSVKGKTAGMVLIVRRENYTQEAGCHERSYLLLCSLCRAEGWPSEAERATRDARGQLQSARDVRHTRRVRAHLRSLTAGCSLTAGRPSGQSMPPEADQAKRSSWSAISSSVARSTAPAAAPMSRGTHSRAATYRAERPRIEAISAWLG